MSIRAQFVCDGCGKVAPAEFRIGGRCIQTARVLLIDLYGWSMGYLHGPPSSLHDFCPTCAPTADYRMNARDAQIRAWREIPASERSKRMSLMRRRGLEAA